MPPPLLTVGQRVCKCKGVSKEILRGSQNFEIGSRAASDAQFVVRGQELPTTYVRTKFEGRSSIRLRNIGTFSCGALIDPMTLTFDLLTLKMWELHVT